MRRLTALVIPLSLIAASFSMTGCCYYELRDMWDDCSSNTRATCSARMAWFEYNDSYENQPNRMAFGHGFRDGYAAILKGSDGCPPNMPPRCYWNDCYDDCDGRSKVAAYYNGYSQGVYIAQAEGLGNCGRLAVRRPVYTGHAPVNVPPMETTGPGVVVPDVPPTTDAVEPPPPAPAAGGPAIPADPGYEDYNADGLYYE